jgi:hypothetical protein
MAAAWLALTLAEFGLFRGWVVLLAAAATALTLWAKTESAPGPLDRWAVAIAGASLFLSLPPSEMILGGWDPGVYLHSAARIAEEGGLRWTMPEFAGLSDVERETIVRNFGGALGPYSGMWFLPDGRVSPQFFHLYPALLAVAYAIGGIWAALLVNPLLNAASIVAIYALVRRMFDDRWAFAAALVLALNPAQIWQSRFCTSEILAQVLLLGGMCALSGTRRRDAAMAGAAFGLALLCRYDTIMFLVPLAATLLVFWPEWPVRKQGPVLLCVLLPLAAQAFLHQRIFSPYYHPVSDLVRMAALLAAGGLAVGLMVLDAPRIRLRARLAPYAMGLRAAGALLVVGVSLYAWFLRPRSGGAESGNLLYLVSVFGPVGLTLSLVGIVALLLRADKAWQRAWVLASLGVTSILVAQLFNDHFLMWASRRFIPVAVPLLCVAMVGAARLMPRPGLVVLVLAIGLQVFAASSVIRTRDWPGLVAWYNGWRPHVDKGATLYTDQPGFAAPFRFLHGVPSFELFSRHPDRREKLADVMRDRARGGGVVLFLTMSGPAASTNLVFEEMARRPLDSHILNSSKRGLPKGEKPRGGDFVLYRVASAHP